MTRDWTQPQHVGAHVIECMHERSFGRWCIVLDGLPVNYRTTKGEAFKIAEHLLRGLLPQSDCPRCGKPVVEGRWHDRPRLHSEKPVRCWPPPEEEPKP